MLALKVAFVTCNGSIMSSSQDCRRQFERLIEQQFKRKTVKMQALQRNKLYDILYHFTTLSTKWYTFSVMFGYLYLNVNGKHIQVIINT